MRSSIKSIFVAFTSCVAAAALVGCVASAESGSDAERVDTADQAIATCTCWGSYSCPNNPNADSDYDPPGCGWLTKPQAQSRCESLCSVTCVDSGWICE